MYFSYLYIVHNIFSVKLTNKNSMRFEWNFSIAALLSARVPTVRRFQYANDDEFLPNGGTVSLQISGLICLAQTVDLYLNDSLQDSWNVTGKSIQFPLVTDICSATTASFSLTIAGASAETYDLKTQTESEGQFCFYVHHGNSLTGYLSIRNKLIRRSMYIHT